MATSSRTKTNNRKATSAKEWKKATGTTPVDLPSGNVALVKRPGLDKLLAMNLIPDSLTPLALDAVNKGKGKKPSLNPEDMIRDPKAVQEVFQTFDRICAAVVVEPEVRWHMVEVEDGELQEIPESERDEDVLYTDEVDAQDKMFIFQFVVGGTRDLEKFRRKFGQSMDDILSSENVEDQA